MRLTRAAARTPEQAAAARAALAQARPGLAELDENAAATTAAEGHLDRLVTAERGRLQHKIGRLQTTLDGLDRQATAAGQRWQHATNQHTAATGGQRRLGRTLQGVRQRLEQPERPAQAARPTRGRPAPGNQRPGTPSSPTRRT